MEISGGDEPLSRTSSMDESVVILESAIVAGNSTFGDDATPLMEAVLLNGDCPTQSLFHSQSPPTHTLIPHSHTCTFDSTGDSQLLLSLLNVNTDVNQVRL